MKIYIISLNTATDRRDFQKQQFAKLGLEFKFFDAVSPKDISEKTYRHHYHDWRRPLKRTELGCYLSHQELWHKTIANNAPILILEDDILLSNNISSVLANISNLKNKDLINLETFNRKKHLAKTSVAIDNKHKLLKVYINKSGAGAYVLFPSGAKKILHCESKKGIAIADAQLYRCYSMQYYQVEPALAVQAMIANNLGININNDKIATSFIGRETKKPKKFIFKYLLSEISILVKKLSVFHKSNTRKVMINTNDFL